MKVRGAGKKNGMLVLGLMSGTAADGIDVTLSRISGAPPRVAARLLKHTAVKFPANVRAEILRVAEQRAVTAGGGGQTNFLCGGGFGGEGGATKFSGGWVFCGDGRDGVLQISRGAFFGGFDWKPRADDFPPSG